MNTGKKVALVSRVDYPLTIRYGEESFILPPKRKTKKEFVKDLLGPTDPKEVMILN